MEDLLALHKHLAHPVATRILVATAASDEGKLEATHLRRLLFDVFPKSYHNHREDLVDTGILIHERTNTFPSKNYYYLNPDYKHAAYLEKALRYMIENSPALQADINFVRTQEWGS